MKVTECKYSESNKAIKTWIHLLLERGDICNLVDNISNLNWKVFGKLVANLYEWFYAKCYICRDIFTYVIYNTNI